MCACDAYQYLLSAHNGSINETLLVQYYEVFPVRDDDHEIGRSTAAVRLHSSNRSGERGVVLEFCKYSLQAPNWKSPLGKHPPAMENVRATQEPPPPRRHMQANSRIRAGARLQDDAAGRPERSEGDPT